MSKTVLRRVVLILALLLFVASTSDAYAKKKKKGDLGKGDVIQNIEKKSSSVEGVDKRSDEEKKRRAEEAKKATAELEEGKGGTKVKADEVVENEVDPEKVNEILGELERDNREIVNEYKSLLEKNPTNPKAPDWLFRIAEFNWEIASYQHLRAMHEWNAELEAMEAAGTAPEELPQPPTANYDAAIEYYKKIVASHGSYERMDEVLYKLGDGLIRAGRAKEGVGYLHRLTQSYKNSQYLDRVYLSLGEYYFEKRQAGTAMAAYEEIVTNHKDSRVFNYAQYKLGWTYFNQGDEDGIRKAIETFKAVVETLDKQYAQYIDPNTGLIKEEELPRGEVSFRNQAINDLIVGFGEVDGGWLEAREYFQKKLTPKRLREKMEMFAELMGTKGLNPERIAIYRWLMEEDPLHPNTPKYAERIVDSYFNDNRIDKIEGVTREFIDYFAPDGKWARANRDNEDAYRLARTFAEDKLYSLAATNLLEATKAVERDDMKEANAYFAQARKDHETFLERYPESQYAYDMNFYYAYILDENSDRILTELKDAYRKDVDTFRAKAKTEALPDLQAAAAQYQRVIEMRDKVPEGGEDQTRVSANRQVFVYANVLAAVDPSWSIEASGDAKNFKVEEKDSAAKEAEPLSEAELSFVGSAEQYAELFPKHEDTPGFLWRSAEIYRSRYNYDNAAQRFDDLISNFPDHEYAAQAVGSMFALYNKAENWPKIEYWAEWLIERKNFKVYSKTELENAIGYSIGQQSEDLLEEKKYREAAEKLYTLKTRFPDRHELVAPAIFATANIYRDGKMVVEAIDKYDEFLREYPKREEAPMANFQAALLYERKTDFKKAAEKFEAMPELVAAVEAAADEKDEAPKKDKPKADEKKAEGDDEEEVDFAKANKENTEVALLNAIAIRRGLEDWDMAIADSKRYLELYPGGKSRESVVLGLAGIYKGAGQDEQVISQLETYLNTYKDSKVVRLNARLEIAKTHARIGKSVIKEQDRQFSKIESELSSLSPEEQAEARVVVAEMRFIQAERKLTQFKEVKLEFPVRTLKKRIKEKAGYRTEAEAAYKAVIELKIARWSSAAAYRIGEMAINFRDQFRDLPIPPEIKGDPDKEDEYIAWVEDTLIYPAEDAAIKGFEFALDLAHQLKVYNEWSRKSASYMSTLQPDAFPVTGEKGVVTEHKDMLVPSATLIVEAPPRKSKKRDDAAPGGEGAPKDGAAPAEGDAPADAEGTGAEGSSAQLTE